MTPCEPPCAPPGPGRVLLGNNENAYGAPPSVIAAMQRVILDSHRYQFSLYRCFVGAIAARHKVARDRVIGGAGSTELLYMAASAFTGPGRSLVMGCPTFEVIGQHAEVCGARVVRVPLTCDFRHDTEAMLAQVDASTGLVYLCNPNNPTGSLTPRRELDALIARLPRDVHVLVDEAYHDFVDSPDYASYLDRPVAHERLIVLRTFSKTFGMAGLRLGYAVGPRRAIARLHAQRVQRSMSAVALAGALAGLGDAPALAAVVERNAGDRATFLREAGRRGIRCIPSHTNFVMIDTGRPVQAVVAHFAAHGITVGRPFPPLDTHLRVSLGRPDEMQLFWSVWDRLP